MSRGSASIVATSGIRTPLAGPDATRITRIVLPADGSPVLWGVRSAVSQICLIVPENTAVLVRTGDHDELAAPAGGAVVLAGHERFAAAAAAPDGGRMLVITSPRTPIEALVSAVCGTGLLRRSTLLGAAARFLGELSEEGGHGPDAGSGFDARSWPRPRSGFGAGGELGRPGEIGRPPAPGLDRMLRELIVAVLLEARASDPVEPLWVGLFDRAVEHIIGHRTDRNLGTESLAGVLNISMRQLQRSFAAAGTTPHREIRRHRAALAATVLGDRAFAALSVDQIAHQCGFRNAADMRRALSLHELPSPRRLRTLGADLSPERSFTTS